MKNNAIEKLSEAKEVLEDYLLDTDGELNWLRHKQVTTIIEELDMFIYEDENCLLEEEEIKE